MAYLVDTSILVRLANTADAFYPIAAHAVTELHRRGEVLCITAQNLIEFRSVATRPIAANGLGLPAADVQTKTAIFEAALQFLNETPDIYRSWKSLISNVPVIGKQVHDARLVAVCLVYRLSHLLTFNVAHFSRFAAAGVNVVPVDPANI